MWISTSVLNLGSIDIFPTTITTTVLECNSIGLMWELQKASFQGGAKNNLALLLFSFEVP